MPEGFPYCFGKNVRQTQSTAANHHGLKAAHSSVVCVYQPKSSGFCKPVSITWCKSRLGQGFNVHIEDPHVYYVCQVNMSPWRLWKKHGSKRVRIKGKTFRVFWDLSNAKYMSGPEPYQGFYVAVLCDRDIILLLGDMQREAYKNNRLGSSIMVKSTLLSRKEHLLGKKVYHTRVQFNDIGSMHDITIKCHVGADVKDPWLCIRVDKQTMVHIKQLLWKFRGNQMIYVDGQIIEVLWDAHNWLFDSSCPCAVFMFRTRVQKEKQCLEDRTGTHSSSSILERGMVHNFNDEPAEHPSQKRTSFASILEWPNTHSFKGSKECSDPSPAHSLILYAWRSE